jgi:uracil-DNA glycosylase
LALERYVHYVRGHGGVVKGWSFKHGGRMAIEGFPTVYMSYHPSPQNTNTGKLTEGMFRNVLRVVRSEVG